MPPLISLLCKIAQGDTASVSPCTHVPAVSRPPLAGCAAGRRSPFLHFSPLLLAAQ
jgi:hypothetical protein